MKADFKPAGALLPPNTPPLAGVPAGVVENALLPSGLLGVVFALLFADVDGPPNGLDAAGALDEAGAPKPKAAGVLTVDSVEAGVVVCPKGPTPPKGDVAFPLG